MTPARNKGNQTLEIQSPQYALDQSGSARLIDPKR